MLIGVIADTHGRISDYTLVKDSLGLVDQVIHLGDFIQDALDIASVTGKEMLYVAGNCDYGASCSAEREIQMEGWQLLVTHGHQYGVKAGLDRLLSRSIAAHASVVIFGHTHIPHLAVYRNILVLNPGSLAWPRGGSGASYGILRIGKENIQGAILSSATDEVLMQAEIKRG